MNEQTKDFSDLLHSLSTQPYVAPEVEVISIDVECPFFLGSVHVGDGFNGDNSISGGNYVGDSFNGEDIQHDGGGNVGNGFGGWDLEWEINL